MSPSAWKYKFETHFPSFETSTIFQMEQSIPCDSSFLR